MTETYREELGDLDELPAELRKELTTGRSERQQQVLAVINDRGGGRASLNEILVGLWRVTGKVLKRQNVSTLTAKMVKSKVLWRIEGEIVVYSTTDPAAPKAQPFQDEKPGPKRNGGRRPQADACSLLSGPAPDPPPLDSQTAKKAQKAYNLRKDGRLDFGEIATQLDLPSADTARFMAHQYAKENNKKWPV